MVRAGQNPIITRNCLDFSYSPFTGGKKIASWKRRAEIIDYCVRVVDEAQVRKPDHRPGDAGFHPSLSVGVGVVDEAKVDIY